MPTVRCPRNAFLVTLALGCVCPLITAAPDAFGRGAHPTLVYSKANPVISAATNRLLDRAEDNGRVKVWVFFTDKGIRTQQALAAALTLHTPHITAKAAQRRAKVGLDGAVFADLRGEDTYVAAVRDRGGDLRHVSRWLNAASFTINRMALESVAALPFVREIRVVARYQAPRVEIAAEPLHKTSIPTLPGPYDYGESSGQLVMINVPLAHAAGYDGSGVLVCMMDTGFRKDHTAFANAYAEGRVWAEYDFIFDDENVQNEPEDVSSQHNHGTYNWSALGGIADGDLYGPAFQADFILAKTEDVRSETAVEEDNWVAGMEWADSIGADVISSSVGYTNWYAPEDFDGNTCVTTVAADIAASLGIVVCNSAGNYGPNASTLLAPSDANTIISVGAVYNTELIVGFSSRGPTFDGRTKPEVCAQGSSTRCATASETTSFGYVSGTSLSCPLVGGAAALVIQAHPDWTPSQVREALMETADNASSPNNSYGWGIIDVMAAIDYSFVCECSVFCDLDGDQSIIPTDVSILVNHIFRGHAAPSALPDCPRTNGDWDCSGLISPLDLVNMVNHVYRQYGTPCDPCAE